MPEYTLKDIAAKTGITPRTVIDWAEKDVVRPDGGRASGSGTPRRYSEENLLQFAVAKELVRVGFPVRRIKRLLDIIREAGPGMWTDMGAIVLGLSPKSGKFNIAAIAPKGEDVWSHVTAKKNRERLTRHQAATFIVLSIDDCRKRLVET